MSHSPQRGPAAAESLFDVFIQLYVLHAASKNPVDASQVVELLTQRGYNVNNQAMSALLCLVILITRTRYNISIANANKGWLLICMFGAILLS